MIRSINLARVMLLTTVSSRDTLDFVAAIILKIMTNPLFTS